MFLSHTIYLHRRTKHGIPQAARGGAKKSAYSDLEPAPSAAPVKKSRKTVELALENGINYFDMASADAVPFSVFGNTLGSRRKDVYFQIHFGACYDTGVYGWTVDLDKIKRSVDWQLQMLRTDYIDFGFIHCIDEQTDLNKVMKEGILDYIRHLKEQGVIRHIGLSSHTPQVAETALDTGLIDMLMFSINPGYDYRHGDYAIGGVEERMALYRRCEAEGVGISVMKAFSGGQLLSADTSPFGRELSEYQCIQYALINPAFSLSFREFATAAI